jgi:hypothetical protein
VNDRKHWLDEPRHVRLLWRLFLVLLAVTVLAELAVAPHPHFEVDGVFAFHAAYGFLACLVMILVAKGLGALLKRPDDYYRDGND